MMNAATQVLTVASLDGLEVPYFDVRGSQDGPRLTVLAGVHGAEYTSIAAARRFALALDSAAVSGRITVVPVVNIPGFWERAAFVVPADGKNLNRCFPGDPHGSYSQVLADAVFQNLVAGSDYLLDMHAGDIPEALEPFSIYEESPVEAQARAMALAYGLPHCVRQSSQARTVAGSTSAAAADAGIPAIIAESGGNGLMDQASIERHLAGLHNLARALHLLPGAPVSPGHVHHHDGWYWARTEQAGWWEPAVQTGDDVDAGQPLGTVNDVWGGPAATITTPQAGTVLFLTTSPAVGKNGLLLGLAKAAPRR